MQEPLNEKDQNNAMKENSEKSVFRDFLEKKKASASVFAVAGIILIVLGAVGGFVLFHKLFGPSLKSPDETEEKGQNTKTEEKLENVVMDDEIRGVYIASVSNINFPSKAGIPEDQLRKELDSIVENSRRVGFDTIYFQARPAGDALYDSALFPTSRYLSGKEGKDIDLDPLAYLIEKASKYDMKVVAWVNPYRVTAGKYDTKEDALEGLSDENFAKKNPDETVFYGGKLYFNPGSEAVRKLIADGVREICEGYDVAGILYDDYFYPYPVSGETFDDAAAFDGAGTDLSLGDWRRENVNKMVKLTYDTVKSVSKEMTFGISPFGIWKNASSDLRGSDTRGMEAYSSLYCDALAWIEGEYIDYISPQIYWERGYEIADFSVLTRWWSAQVDGTKVKLVISHAAYRAGAFKLGGDEIAQQIHYARNFMGSCGNIQYGYADIVKNTGGVADALTALYDEPYNEEETNVTVKGISFAYPGENVKTTDSARFVTASSDPAYPVYTDSGKVGRTKNGFFSILMPLSVGNNTLTLSQNGEQFSLSVTRFTASQSAPASLKKFQIQSLTPSPDDGVLVSSGGEIPVSITAPHGCRVSVRLGDESVSLKPTLNPSGSDPYLKEVYKGSIDAPVVSDGNALLSVGKLSYSVSGPSGNLTRDGAEVRVIPSTLHVTATVQKDYSHLKISSSSSFYDDYTPAVIGMQEEVIGSANGFYQLAFGGFIANSNVTVKTGAAPAKANLTKAKITHQKETCDLNLTLGAAPPIDVSVEEGLVTVTLFSTETELEKNVPLEKNLLFSSMSASFDEEKGSTVLKLRLKSVENYYGFDHSYADGQLIISFRNPSALAEGNLPLKGKRIVVDAGHGGEDLGALGYLPNRNEKDLNLSIALALRDELKALGAEVLMTRTLDNTVSLNERMDFLLRENPDLSVSVHHNSVNEKKDANAATGSLGLYWSPAGRSLARYVYRPVSEALVLRDHGYRSQKLALCRNHRFPQALIETAYICSPGDYELSLRADYVPTCAKAMKQGILDWYAMQARYLGGGTK